MKYCACVSFFILFFINEEKQSQSALVDIAMNFFHF